MKELDGVPSGFILVTCRESLVMLPGWQTLLLNSLSKTLAMELLADSAGPSVKWTGSDLIELATNICGCNAFALVMIGSFLKATRCSVKVCTRMHAYMQLTYIGNRISRLHGN